MDFSYAMVFSFFRKPPEKMVAKPAVTPRPPALGVAVPLEEKITAPALDEENDGADFSDFPFSEAPSDFQDELVVDPLDADIGQAALLYANGQDEATRLMLENAVQVYRSAAAERLWLMLFDLYRLIGWKAPFEALGIDYAMIFSSSPPTWRETSHVAAAVRSPGAGDLSFAGELLGRNDAGFDSLRLALAANAGLSIDLSRVRELDAPGCARLRVLLQQARKAGRTPDLLACDEVDAQIGKRIAAGLAEDGECWLLQLEFHQLRGRQAAFDDLAIGYAVTFEVSPPSWECWELQRAAVAEPLATIDPAVSGEAYALRGEIKASRFADLAAFAELHDPLVIDCSALSRIDFISAGALLNVLSTLRRGGKDIVLRHANHLVAELFAVVGIKAVAEITFIKY